MSDVRRDTEAPPPGRYRHYKGKIYEVLGLARHCDTEEPFVVYRCLYGDYSLWLRPVTDFNAGVENDGRVERRFVRIDEPVGLQDERSRL